MIIFFIVSLFSVLMSRVRSVTSKARYAGAVFTLILLGFLVFFWLTAAYRLFMNAYLWPTLVGFNYASFLNLQNLPEVPSDMSSGYWIFLASWGFLALITVVLKHHSTREKLR